MGRICRLVAAALLLFSTPAVAQTYSVVWDPPTPAVAAALPAEGFNVYRNGLSITTVPSTTTTVVLTSPFVGDKVEVSAFAHDSSAALLESARIAAMQSAPAPSPDGTRIAAPTTATIVDSKGSTWSFGMLHDTTAAGTNYVFLRNGDPSLGGGWGTIIKYSSTVMYSTDTGGFWWSWDGVVWTSTGTTTEPGAGVTPPPPPPPTVDTIQPAIQEFTVAKKNGAQFAIHVKATDNVAIARIDIRVNNVIRKTCKPSVAATPLTCDLSTKTLVVGTNTVSAQAQDAAGNSTLQSQQVTR